MTGDLQWSDECYRIYGFRPQEFVPSYEKFRSIVYPGDLAFVQEQVDAALNNDKHYDIDFRFLRPDGEIGWIHCEGEVTRDADGKPLRFFGTHVDITERKRAEEALLESEEKFRTLFESMAPGVFYQRSDGILIDANPAALSMFELTREQFMGRDSYDPRWKVVSESGELLPAEQHPSMIALRSGKMVRDLVVGVYNPKRDVMRWLSTNAEPQFRTGDATPYQVFVTMYDITERKRAEDALRESHDRFEATIASLDDAVLLVDPVTRLISECNDATTRIFGYSHEELVGRGTGFLHVDPAHLEQFGREASATYENPGYYRRVFHMRRKDGGVFPTEHFVRPIKDPNGRILCVVSVVRDITERKRTEEALRYQNEMRQIILDNIPVMVGFFDREGHYQLINRCWQSTLGWSLEEMLQHKDVFAEFYPDPAYRKYVMDYITSAAGARHWSDFKTRIRDGHVLDTSWINVPLLDGSIIGLGIDITDRKRAEDAIALTSRKLNLLSSITRHDINNQLTVLMGYISLLEKKQIDPTLNEYFGKVSTAAKRISAMIQFTKEYERIGVKAPTWQDTRTLVDTAAKQVPLGKVIVKNYLPAGMEVFADPLIVKVCYNLIDNAVRYGGKITTIQFAIEERDGDQVIVCEDDGDGVPVGEKEKIFERGFGKNTGMGLFLAREILDITGITIRETGEPGKGARFEMKVPKGVWRITGKGEGGFEHG